MKTIRITDIGQPDFGPVWELYKNSFPLFEQRTLEHQQTALKSENFHLVAYVDNGMPVGFIGYWDFPDYLYIEHYAIDPDLRGEGYGSRILKTLMDSTDKRIILEIDEVKDDISSRRLRFYERLGFVINPYVHPIHRYRPDIDHGDASLRIMSFPNTIDPDTYQRFDRDLSEIVMKRD